MLRGKKIMQEFLWMKRVFEMVGLYNGGLGLGQM